LLVVAQQRWLVSFDNVHELSKKVSAWLCMLATGAATSSRKLFTDSDQAILRAKRPVIVTAVKNVVTAPDLLDRTITLSLPPIPSEKRKSEFAIEQEMRKEGVRGRIFGYILDGLVAALAGHSEVRVNMPRMADLFSWATAAEQGLGLESGSILAAFNEQQSQETAASVLETRFAQAIMELAAKGFCGTATEIAHRIQQGQTAQEVGNELSEIAPSLRKAGYVVDSHKSHGKKIFELSKQSAVVVPPITPIVAMPNTFQT
jgi:hypothetical protein